MPLKVIGAGWGRTGTESLKKALEMLGYDKCFHMFELIKDGKRVEYFEQLERGEKPDYEKLFEGYQAAVDFPAAKYYREFMQQYPDAKVILTWRPADKWYDSASKTILRGLPNGIFIVARIAGIFSKNISYFPRVWKYVKASAYDGVFKGRKDDREFMLKLYDEWVEEVKRSVPAERLLVFEAKDGWEPLCKFLNVQVPSEPYPRGNDTEQFLERTKTKNFLKEFK